jgi:hypothetical protein
MTTAVANVDEFVEVSFEPLEEKWNTYVLEDGTVIRARSILVKVFAPRNAYRYLSTGSSIKLKTFPVFAVTAPPTLRGKPSIEPPTLEELQNPAKFGEAVKIMHHDEQFNVYKIVSTGEVFKTKMVASDLAIRLRRYDEEGQPLYVVNHAVVVMTPLGGATLPTP